MRVQGARARAAPVAARARARALARRPARRPARCAAGAGRVAHLVTYPVKGLAGAELGRCELLPGASAPGDRRFALLRAEHQQMWLSHASPGAAADELLAGREGKDPGHHSNKHLFHQGITDPLLSAYECTVEGDELRVRRRASGEEQVRADTSTADGRREVEEFFASALQVARPRLVEAPGASFANVGGRPGEHTLHVVSAESVRAAGEAIGEPELDWRRFRPNILLSGTQGRGVGDPFNFELCGRYLALGPKCVIRINEPTVRCPVTRVDPDSGETTQTHPDVHIREELPQLEASIFGRERAPLRTRGSYLGLYATVVQKGVVGTGDPVELI